jgi:hypothetical protein
VRQFFFARGVQAQGRRNGGQEPPKISTIKPGIQLRSSGLARMIVKRSSAQRVNSLASIAKRRLEVDHFELRLKNELIQDYNKIRKVGNGGQSC